MASLRKGSVTARATAILDDHVDMELDSSSTWREIPDTQFKLPPTDGGKDAWRCLAAGFCMEVIVWGFPWSYGIFQDYYSSSPPFAGSSGVSIIGTSAIGILYMAAPFIFAVLVRYPGFRRPCIVVGIFIMCLSLGLSSLCTTVPQLIATQGILYGIGAAIAYSPVITFLEEWFVHKKGFAYGLLWAGTGLGGVATPLLLQFLLDKYGFRTTLRIWTGVVFVITLPLVPFLKPRLPLPATNRARIGLTFLRNKPFWILQIGNFVEALGFFLPTIYLPTYTRQLGFSTTVSALPIILINIAAVVGSISMGTIVDRWHVTTGILVSTTGAVISIFFLWGFSTSLAPLLTFCIMYGLFAGSFANTWPGIIREVQHRTGQVEGPMMFSFLSLGRGAGNMLSGPLSEALIKAGYIGGAGLYGTEYGSLVLFTGITAALGGIGVVGRRVGWL
ncbi:MFS general substrate transporter [Ophiobolus disseminans]|uniref:MFS general substrate transporter n=1 Tax=Ophiobolus disseminans TaxID=1469910 RepID=A0A6A7ALK6_9PLEO|nr:MFS general substrate transporter [Ophiobolus disseminans]